MGLIFSKRQVSTKYLDETIVKTSFRRCKRPGSLSQGIPISIMKLHNDVLENLNFFIPVHQHTEMITKNMYTFNERLVGWWYIGDLLVYFVYCFLSKE